MWDISKYVASRGFSATTTTESVLFLTPIVFHLYIIQMIRPDQSKNSKLLDMTQIHFTARNKP